MNSERILVTGGSGFLGGALIQKLVQRNYRITVISRDPIQARRKLGQEVEIVTNLEQIAEPKFCAVINLAGTPIFANRWTSARKKLIRESRIDLTNKLVSFLSSLALKPKTLISGSAIGVYGNQYQKPLNEESGYGNGFSAQLCQEWEQAALTAQQHGIRVCIIRTGLVLNKNGGLLKQMLPLFNAGLGGQLGNGEQWMSWIHLSDWISIVETLLNCPELAGTFNATAPVPVTNKEFSQKLADHLHKPLLLPLPAGLLKLMLGEMSELMLGSQKVIPERLLNNGFEFNYDNLDSALQQIFSNG
jgi:uncharacterized protein